jgi:serine/threonine protein kinase
MPMHDETYPDLHHGLPAGTVVDGRYKIVRKIGQGGFAVVYLAEHTSLGRQVALKVLDLTGNQRDVAMFRTRFQREAQLASQLDNVHIVRIHDFGFVTQNQQPYMAMELLEGHDLEEELLRFGPLTPERARALFDGALDGLAHAHRRGIIHKDLKPSNLFICHPNTPHERMVVVDFGIAHLYDDPEGRLTQTNQYTGTPAYAAPEYIDSQAVSTQLDVYQMGLILGEALSGTPVVEASSPMAFLIAHCNGHQRLDARLQGTPVAEVIERAVQVMPDRRHADAGELREALLAVPTASIPDLSGSGYVSKRSPKALAAAQPPQTLHTEPPGQHAMLVPGATHPSGQGTSSKLPLMFGAIAALCLLLIVPGVGLIAYAMLTDEAVTPQSSPSSHLASQHGVMTTELDRALDEQLNPRDWQKLYAKFGHTHQAQRFLVPIFEFMVPAYFEHRRLHPDDLTFIAAIVPSDTRMLFDSSATQVMQALHSDVAQEALDSELQAWRLGTSKMQPVMADLYYYWQEDKLWEKDGGKAAIKIDERLKDQLTHYTIKRDALNATMRKKEVELLTMRKEMLGDRNLTAEPEIIDALLALNTLHVEVHKDPKSAATTRAHARYMDHYKIARRAAQRVEKPIGKFVYLGVDTHIDNMRTYNQYVDVVIKGAKSGDSHLDMLNHQNWLNSGFHDVWLNYYRQTLDDKKVRALHKMNAK